MRIQEIFTDDEWQRLEQLIYASAYKALVAYQQQRATQQSNSSNPSSTHKPLTAKKAKTLARKAKRIPHAVAPKPLLKPNPLPQTKAEVTQAYRPVQTARPLPPTTRLAVAKAKPAAPKPIPSKPAPASITDPTHIDQATRRWLPPDKKGPNPIDIISP